MAAGAPTAGGSVNNGRSGYEGATAVNGSTGNGFPVTDNAALRHNPGLSVEWSPEEQSLLEELRMKYASENSILRYAKIAMQLNDKTVRDVALRCRWMTKKEIGKRRKEEGNSSKKSKEKKEKNIDSMPKSTNRANGQPYAQPSMPRDNDDGISYKDIGGNIGQLLEQIAQALDQISANIAAFKIHENISLFCQARNNILSILHDSLNDSPETMKQMPPLPVKLNEDLANLTLPPPSVPKPS